KFTLEEEEIESESICYDEENIKRRATLNIEGILEEVKDGEMIVELLGRVKDLDEEVVGKRKGVERKEFRVGLFGGFSGGKWSFGNGLVGGNVVGV
ncbi:hypothetical protein, partial [Bacillus mycoides]|uniref:hypothetical protein n=1 Tax=Bacillus mycoides TaxID=1405 RepID=UPI001C92F15F